MKTVIKHRQDGHYTACGVYTPEGSTSKIKTNKTWKGVTCKRCLRVKARAERIANALRANRRTRKTVRATSPIASNY
jgi:hypothetical protein